VDRKLLTVALKGTSEQLRRRFWDACRNAGAEMLKEDMEALGRSEIKRWRRPAVDHRRRAATRIGRYDQPQGHGREQYVV